jgi:hypothetical protein
VNVMPKIFRGKRRREVNNRVSGSDRCTGVCLYKENTD